MAVNVGNFRDTHTAIRDAIDDLVRAARELPTATREKRGAIRERIVEFLRDEVKPHMVDDERTLYPEVAVKLRSQFATAAMNYDHIAIRHWIDDIAAADLDDVPRLQELLYGLHALVRVHMWKETELFLGALDSPVWPAGR